MDRHDQHKGARHMSGGVILARADFQSLVDALHAHGYAVIAPTLHEGAIVYDQVSREEDIPIGWEDQQEAGRYQAVRRGDAEMFGYAVGPRTWKQWLFPPRAVLWRADRQADGFVVKAEAPPVERYAFLGMRACELSAIAIQDKVFLQSDHKDVLYADRRRNSLFIAVNCSRPSGTCFCVSMKTGPKVDKEYDLCLTEIMTSDRHDFLIEIGSERGEGILEGLSLTSATQDDIELARAVSARAEENMGRSLQTEGIKALLQENPEHARWDDVAERCLSCGNCTNVCPTCFCSTTQDLTSLDGDETEHSRVWDSCFNLDFSYLGGTSIRGDNKSRYRQWLTHKFANWIDQFDTSGCVGCGRCVTWCPVAIDVTEEISALQGATDQA